MTPIRLVAAAMTWLALLCPLPADQVLRVMTGNLTSGNGQDYDLGEGNRIFKGLHPDIALVQEMNYLDNSAVNLRAWVDGNFGTEFSYFRQSGSGIQIPNGIVSRYPILASGIWDDTTMTNRDYSWARIDIPGDKDLWAISVHISSGGGASQRNTEAGEIRSHILADIPAADYVVLGGDFNTNSRGEACISTLSSAVVTTSPYPADQALNENTNASRARPYDWVMADADLHALKTPLVIGTASFPNGLVFDSTVFTPLSAVTPVMAGDSDALNMQHMGVIRAFLIPTNTAPMVASAANSSSTEVVTDPDSSVYEIVRAASVGLSVLGADDGGEAALKYTWSLTSGPGAVTFSANGTNAAKNSTATFPALGNYTLTATIQDVSGLTVASTIKVRVVQATTTLAVNPSSATLAAGTSQAFTATFLDQFANPMATQPTFAWSTTGGGTISAGGVFSATTVGGPFSVKASGNGASKSSGVTVTRGNASISLAGLTQTYDGNPKSASATTTPAGLAVALLYDGASSPPTAAGSYAVAATISDPNYLGSASGTLTIQKGSAVVALSGITATYDGAPKSATATTTPAGVAVSILYDGAPAAPVNAGSYAVTATISDPNYQGSASGSLVVQKATATIQLTGLAATYDGNPKPVTASTTPAGLVVTVLYDGSPTAPAAAGSYAVSAAISDANYQGSATATLAISPDAFTVWKNAHFTAMEQEAGLAADLADPDSDGLANLVEYALDSDPRAFTPLPTLQLQAGVLSLDFTRPAGLPGIHYSAEISADAVVWTPGTLEVVATGMIETVRATLPAGDSRFLRLRIDRD